MNAIPKIVFSRKGILQPTDARLTTGALRDATRNAQEQGFKAALSPDTSSWENVPIASGDLTTEIHRLKQQEGKPILAHGGASFAQSLVQLGLVDEYQLLIHPVVLGKGLPLFSTITAPMYLKLESSTAFKSGVIANVYRPIHQPALG
jgi:dihydrofolate reductase